VELTGFLLKGSGHSRAVHSGLNNFIMTWTTEQIQNTWILWASPHCHTDALLKLWAECSCETRELKVKSHLKITIRSYFSHPHALFSISLWNTKEDILKKCLQLNHWQPLDVLQNIPQKKVSQVWNKMRMSKLSN